MGKLTMFDRVICRAVSDAVEEALKPVADRFGVQIKTKGGTYTPGNYLLRLEIATIGDDGQVHTQAVEDFRKYAPAFGLEPDDLGREFRTGRGRYRITGLSSYRPKFPINGVDVVTGKPFKFTLEMVKKGLAREKE